SEEELIAKDKELAEANARIAELEKNLNAMQRLLQLQSQELAERQIQATASTPNSAATAAVTPLVAAQAELDPTPATASAEANAAPDTAASTNVDTPAPETAQKPAPAAA